MTVKVSGKGRVRSTPSKCVHLVVEFGADAVCRAVAVDPDERRALLVPGQERNRDVVVLLEALEYGRFGVVKSRAESEPFLDGLRSDRELYHGIDAARGEEDIERLGLLDGARVAVEDEASLGCVGLSEPFFEQPQYEMVGHEMSGVHVCLDAHAERCFVRRDVAQEITAREVRNSEMPSERCALCPFAGAGSAEDDDPHRGLRLCVAGCELQRSDSRLGDRAARGGTLYPGPRQFERARLTACE
jgi:hypothetical protein